MAESDRFFRLVAALVCQPQEHGLLTSEGLKKDLCLHFFMEAIAFRTSLSRLLSSACER